MPPSRPSSPSTERLKAAVQYSTGKTAEKIVKEDLPNTQFSKSFLAALSETTFSFMQESARDLEYFSKHGKRSTVNIDDVKLLARKNDHIMRILTEKANDMARGKGSKKRKASET